jgi:hypothetical protein
MYRPMNDAKPLEKVEDMPRNSPSKGAVGIGSGDKQEQIAPEGIFENIRSQYSETLYKSKVIRPYLVIRLSSGAICC